METYQPKVAVPCRWCGIPTPMLATKECDRCWQLHMRIVRDPELAQKMLSALRKKKPRR